MIINVLVAEQLLLQTTSEKYYRILYAYEIWKQDICGSIIFILAHFFNISSIRPLPIFISIFPIEISYKLFLLFFFTKQIHSVAQMADHHERHLLIFRTVVFIGGMSSKL